MSNAQVIKLLRLSLQWNYRFNRSYIQCTISILDAIAHRKSGLATTLIDLYPLLSLPEDYHYPVPPSSCTWPLLLQIYIVWIKESGMRMCLSTPFPARPPTPPLLRPPNHSSLMLFVRPHQRVAGCDQRNQAGLGHGFSQAEMTTCFRLILHQSISTGLTPCSCNTVGAHLCVCVCVCVCVMKTFHSSTNSPTHRIQQPT